jgi:hypothetical protein
MASGIDHARRNINVSHSLLLGASKRRKVLADDDYSQKNQLFENFRPQRKILLFSVGFHG